MGQQHGLVVAEGRRVFPLWRVLLLLLAGCQDVLPAPDLDRSIDQPRGKPSAPADTPFHGRADHALPQTQRMPLELDAALMQRGKHHFDTSCAICHGYDGSGVTPLAHQASLRTPPSLVSEPVIGHTVAQLADVISRRDKSMTPYAYELTSHDRWAVIAYLRALQRSRSSALASLPPWVQREARQALP